MGLLVGAIALVVAILTTQHGHKPLGGGGSAVVAALVAFGGTVLTGLIAVLGETVRDLKPKKTGPPPPNLERLANRLEDERRKALLVRNRLSHEPDSE